MSVRTKKMIAPGAEGHMSEQAAQVPHFSGKELREALSLFATGVAVITATTESGERLGATVSSFNSVSLEPPLILFSIARSAKALSAWQTVEGFAVNILGEDQSALSTCFARSLTDKWDGIEPLEGLATDAPLLPGALAWLECRPYAHYDGGDHVIFVGEVLSMQRTSVLDPQPLIFFGSRYRRLDPERQIETPFDAHLWLPGW